MHKDFDRWNELKKVINLSEREILFHIREIWWSSIGVNVGDEEDGKNDLFERPVLIVKRFNQKLAWVVPLTSKKKEGYHYYRLHHDGMDFSIILSQLTLMSVKRFTRRIRKINDNDFDQIIEELAKMLRNGRSSLAGASQEPNGHL